MKAYLMGDLYFQMIQISTMLVNAGDSFQLMSESNTVLGEVSLMMFN